MQLQPPQNRIPLGRIHKHGPAPSQRGNRPLSKIEGDYRVVKEQGRVYVFCPEEYDFEEAVAALKTVFGIVYICPVVIYEDKGFEQMRSDVVEYMKNVHPDYHGTFKAVSYTHLSWNR